jgi:hydroxymethylbilane synthase
MAGVVAVGEARRRLRIGTRGSALARAQTRLVSQALEAAGWETEEVVVRTAGDRAPNATPADLGRGAFVAALERALTSGSIDLAVHSAKDLPTGDRPAVTVIAYPRRADARDAIVTRNGEPLATLPSGARVATSSPRRRAFLLSERDDLDVVPIRGNVDTRLAKLDRGDVDALCVAAAGLDRLGLASRAAERLAPTRMLPAVGQGALAVQIRTDKEDLEGNLGSLDDPTTRRAVTAERSFLEAMGGGCRTPLAAYAVCDDGELTIDGAALDPDGGQAFIDRLTGPIDEAARIGGQLAERLLAIGADSIVGVRPK